MLEPTQNTKSVSSEQLSQVAELIENGIPEDAPDPVQPEPEQESADNTGEEAEQAQGVADETVDGEPESLEEGEEPEAAATLSLKELADRLEIEQSDLYSLEIPLPGDGERITLGELKDGYTEFSKVERQAEKLNEEKTAYENDKLRSYQELQTLVNLLPEVPEQYRAQAAQMQQQHLQTEQARLLEVMPEWKDANNFEAGRSAINGLASEYGFSPAEVAGIADHRLVKLLHDYAGMKAQKAQAQEAAQKITKPPKAPAKQAPKRNKLSDLEKRAKGGDQGALIELVSHFTGSTR